VEPVKLSYEVSKTNMYKTGLTQINNGQWVCQIDVENVGEEVVEVAAEMAGNDAEMGDV